MSSAVSKSLSGSVELQLRRVGAVGSELLLRLLLKAGLGSTAEILALRGGRRPAAPVRRLAFSPV
jgi:hypothetical protein